MRRREEECTPARIQHHICIRIEYERPGGGRHKRDATRGFSNHICIRIDIFALSAV